ncbi:hypothetical protein WA026_004917 [Henosepilachna vigintioctopunctata]|uniref:Uncharacterized protein n=1 Tax=Henosepilachna vigintioctopunctata TaxID=420089 RepID=A0AAW1UVW3_9CUCU
MFGNTTISSRSSSSRSGSSYGRNSSMPSLRMGNPLSPKVSFNPLFRNSDQLTSFDASNFVLQDEKCKRLQKKRTFLRRYNSHESSYSFDIIKPDPQENTPDSTKSRVGSLEESHSSSADRKKEKEYCARDFLDRYSLPRVVKIDGGDPLLLYRCFDSFTKIQAKALIIKKGKEKVDENILHFPEGYSGKSIYKISSTKYLLVYEVLTFDR